MIRKRAQRIIGDPETADDLAQEAFLRLHEQGLRGVSVDNEGAWLYRTVSRLALTRLRDKKRRAELLQQNRPTNSETDSAIDVMAIRKVMGLVGKQEALVASYYHLDGMEQHEIADLLGLHQRKIGRLLERFRAKAKRLLADSPQEVMS